MSTARDRFSAEARRLGMTEDVAFKRLSEGDPRAHGLLAFADDWLAEDSAAAAAGGTGAPAGLDDRPSPRPMNDAERELDRRARARVERYRTRGEAVTYEAALAEVCGEAPSLAAAAIGAGR